MSSNEQYSEVDEKHSDEANSQENVNNSKGDSEEE